METLRNPDMNYAPVDLLEIAPESQDDDFLALFAEATELFAESQQNPDNVIKESALTQFVANTQTLMLEAKFQENWAQFEAMSARLHQLCADNHGLQQAFSGFLGKNEGTTNLNGHSVDDGHGHEKPHDHHRTFEDDDDDDEVDVVPSKKSKEKARTVQRRVLTKSILDYFFKKSNKK